MRTALRVEFPDHQGKYREFCRFEPILSSPEPKSLRIDWAFSRNFPEIETGNLDCRSGNKKPDPLFIVYQ